MNCSFDKNSQTGYLQNFGNLFGLCHNLLGNGICEHKHDEKKVKHHDVPTLTASSMSSIFGSISSNLYIMLSSPSSPQRSFVKDIPCLGARRDLLPFVESRAKFVRLGDPIAINAKLKEVLMPFIPAENFQQAGSCDSQCLGMQDRDCEPGQCESSHHQIGEEALDSIGSSVEKCDESDDDDEMDVDDCDEDVIFVRDMDCDDESDDDDDSNQEEGDEGGYDDDDEEEEDDDDDCSDWDEIDGQYSSACMAAIHDPSSSDSSFATNEIVMKWDSGIDEEVRKIPKVPKILFEFEFSMESDPEIEKVLLETNEKWNKFYCCHFKRKDEPGKVSKKVSFACDDDLLTVHEWDDCEGSRCGPWQQCAVDRDRFKKKIKDSEELLSKVLQPDHRMKMFSIVAGCTFAEDR